MTPSQRTGPYRQGHGAALAISLVFSFRYVRALGAIGGARGVARRVPQEKAQSNDMNTRRTGSCPATLPSPGRRLPCPAQATTGPLAEGLNEIRVRISELIKAAGGLRQIFAHDFFFFFFLGGGFFFFFFLGGGFGRFVFLLTPPRRAAPSEAALSLAATRRLSPAAREENRKSQLIAFFNALLVDRPREAGGDLGWAASPLIRRGGGKSVS